VATIHVVIVHNDEEHQWAYINHVAGGATALGLQFGWIHSVAVN